MKNTNMPLTINLSRSEESLTLETIAFMRTAQKKAAPKYYYMVGTSSTQPSALQHFIDLARAGDITELYKQFFLGDGDIVYGVLVPDIERGPLSYELFVILQYDNMHKNPEVLFQIQLQQEIEVESENFSYDPEFDFKSMNTWDLVIGTFFLRLARRKKTALPPSGRHKRGYTHDGCAPTC